MQPAQTLRLVLQKSDVQILRGNWISGRTKLCLVRREVAHFRLLAGKRSALLGSTGREDVHELLQEQQDVSLAICI